MEGTLAVIVSSGFIYISDMIREGCNACLWNEATQRIGIFCIQSAIPPHKVTYVHDISVESVHQISVV